MLPELSLVECLKAPLADSFGDPHWDGWVMVGMATIYSSFYNFIFRLDNRFMDYKDDCYNHDNHKDI
jgi:hypothetical protein